MKAIQTKQLGVALVGLGNYAEAQLAPANCRFSELQAGRYCEWQ